MKRCPVCNEYFVIDPAGLPTADILIVAEQPLHTDLQAGIPLAGDIGTLMQDECARAGFSFAMTRRMFLWGHGFAGDRSDWFAQQERERDEFLHWKANLLQEMKNRKGVLLLGAGVLTPFLGRVTASNYFGLRLTHILFPPTCGVVMAAPSVISAKATVIGEMRLSLSKFAKAVKEQS